MMIRIITSSNAPINDPSCKLTLADQETLDSLGDVEAMLRALISSCRAARSGGAKSLVAGAGAGGMRTTGTPAILNKCT